ncbi:MAG: bifunctional methylenetetrahydrofolate dehydrogenase/methenyltetrahydrofolate cyclohydrolase FolD [Clostridia bacterium]|nr:bifunctional methylenetetrahydrofolate dehydrogenase/methenyltetrahydrofolate cyclohydrolase FolD [Clostridia bacterium]
MPVIIDGRAVSAAVRDEIKQDAARIASAWRAPSLAVIIVGEDPASQVYVRNKHKACAECGITSFQYELPADTTQRELLSLIWKLNADMDVDGILCQLPLPKHLDEQAVIDAIRPDKDVDAFHPENTGRIMTGDYAFLPCTPAGIMELLRRYEIGVEGKRVVIIGRSNIVGKPMAMLAINARATVTVCNKATPDLPSVTRQADILVSAVGKPGIVTAGMVREGAVVIDVGVNRLPDGKLCGDVIFDEVAPKTSFITPVPGGVGPMTITMLLKNTVTAARGHMEKGNIR